ncbi:MAG: deoxyribose-phosphate aldolase [Chlorobi bacterium]|nr:deoxyribose-phosphate aldolase [Chlorobiota bacterium]
MEVILENFPVPEEFKKIDEIIEDIKKRSGKEKENTEVLKLIFNCIDLTSLNTTDSADGIRKFVDKVNDFASDYPQMPNVAAICVFPVFASVMTNTLKQENVKKAVVSAGFPSSQTFTDIKKLETQRALEFGADEVDIVLSVGEFLEGNYDFVYEEITAVKSVMNNAHLKVILETGALKEPDEIWMASHLCMEAGSEFLKTSTGKQQPAATPEAFYVMAKAAKAFYDKTGKKTGLKAAGGISTTEDVLVYYTIIKDVLGDEWLNNELFRIGASRLANNLLSDIFTIEKGEKTEIKYF